VGETVRDGEISTVCFSLFVDKEFAWEQQGLLLRLLPMPNHVEFAS